MYFYKAFGLTISSEIALPELSDAETTSETDLLIKQEAFTLPELESTHIFRRSVRAHFGRDTDDNLYMDWPGIASFKAIKGHTILVSPVTEDPNLISLFTVSEALGLILFQRGYFLLHASSVLVGDEAWCFMGDPGAGKSTTAAAFIKAGCRLLSDDLTAITFDKDGVAQVLPAYPQLKIWDKTVGGLNYDRLDLQPVSEGVNKFAYQPKSTFSHDNVNLGKVFFLHKARNRKSLQPLNAVEIPTEMVKNFPLPLGLLKGEALKTHFLQSFQCAKSADIWQKRRPEGFNNLELWVADSISQLTNTSIDD
jgi:hypothetical protein